MSQTLDIRLDESVAGTNAAIFSESLIARAEWTAVATALAQGSKTDKEQSARFQALATRKDSDLLETYVDIFCTKSREKTKERIATGAIEKANPALCARLAEERDRVWALLQRKRAIEARDRTAALITIAKEVIDRYAREKARRALLDYDDLIDKTLALFNNVSASWVLYKLDLGIDHILIDEAQDTSPKQWAIIRAIASEFMPGGSRPNVKRTLFAVGDEKQSIFSFQGAAPRAFDEMRHVFERQFDRPELGWKHLRFHHSFRFMLDVFSM